jgi:hypothetical protein
LVEHGLKEKKVKDETNNESEGGGDAIAELFGYDKWPRDVSIAFDRSLGVASLKYVKKILKNIDVDFASVVAEFRAIEAEFLVRIGDNEENAQQVRRIVTEMLLDAARDTDQPFETCQRYWNDLVQLGFYRIERQCLKTALFAITCGKHGHTETGFALLDPLIAELERLRAEPTVAKQAVEYYDGELVSLRKLRARLEAQKNGAESL